jgi:hypothetical protein
MKQREVVRGELEIVFFVKKARNFNEIERLAYICLTQQPRTQFFSGHVLSTFRASLLVFCRMLFLKRGCVKNG